MRVSSEYALTIKNSNKINRTKSMLNTNKNHTFVSQMSIFDDENGQPNVTVQD